MMQDNVGPFTAIDAPVVPAVAEAIEASLHAGSVETVYHRAGHGPPVLLLAPRGIDDPRARAIFTALAARFVVVAPRLPVAREAVEPVSLTTWLRDLLEGLGWAFPCLVADEALCGTAIGFALTHPERVSRVAMLHGDGSDAAGGCTCHDRLEQTGHPLLLLAAGAAPGAAQPLSPDACAELVAFLAGPGAPA